MFDASYFKTALAEQIAASGTKATVEVHLMNAHTYRLRSVIDAGSASIAFEAYRQRVDGGRSEQYWQAKAPKDEGAGEMVRVIAAYDSIVEIVITPAEDATAPRIGFIRE